jgi:hypothetical protein
MLALTVCNCGSTTCMYIFLVLPGAFQISLWDQCYDLGYIFWGNQVQFGTKQLILIALHLHFINHPWFTRLPNNCNHSRRFPAIKSPCGTLHPLIQKCMAKCVLVLLGKFCLQEQMPLGGNVVSLLSFRIGFSVLYNIVSVIILVK